MTLYCEKSQNASICIATIGGEMFKWFRLDCLYLPEAGDQPEPGMIW